MTEEKYGTTVVQYVNLRYPLRRIYMRLHLYISAVISPYDTVVGERIQGIKYSRELLGGNATPIDHGTESDHDGALRLGVGNKLEQLSSK